MYRYKKKIICYVLLISFVIGFLFIRNNNTPTLTKTQENEIKEYFVKSTPNPKIYGILEIPSINLKNPIYKESEKENNVDENIELIEETLSSSSESSRVVLAAHSGNGPHAYFRNLDKLKEGDNVILYYGKEAKEYQYFKKEIVPKIGTVYIDQYNFPYLILITCSKKDDTKQEIYYAKFIKNIP